MKQLIALSQKNKQNCVLAHLTISKLTGKFQHKLKVTLFHDSLLMILVTLNKKKMQL